MAENESITPEKQLLKLIENPNRPGLQRAENAKRQGIKWFSLGALKGRFGFLKSISAKRWDFLGQWFKGQPAIRHVNMALRFCILFLGLYLGYNVVAMAIQLRKASNLIVQVDTGNLSLPAQPPPPLKDLSFYMDKVLARDIFKLGAVRRQESQASGEPVSGEEDARKNYSLVGIAWSDDPVVMIENTKLKRTHFARKGQTLDEQIKIVAIFKDHVVLNYQGEEFELK